jgi:CheY-like chemotaxis protein
MAAIVELDPAATPASSLGDTMITVLVVDDEFGVAEVIAAILEDEGYRVITAVNGKQGLARAAEAKPDVILLDVMMPILSGPAMLRALKADPALARIPVVMMSSLDPASVEAQCEGHVGLLRKPFRASTILRTITEALDGR